MPSTVRLVSWDRLHHLKDPDGSVVPPQDSQTPMEPIRTTVQNRAASAVTSLPFYREDPGFLCCEGLNHFWFLSPPAASKHAQEVEDTLALAC